MSGDPLRHAEQVAQIAGILDEAFRAEGFEVTLVGGSAIEIHAPGIYVSGDMDMVVERIRATSRHQDEIFTGLGFQKQARHWRHGELFVEIVSSPVAGPVEEVRVGDSEFRIVKKEVPLRDRVVGFKHWRYTGYGEQAIEMLVAFVDELDETWLIPELEKEAALDALDALRALAWSSEPITDEVLRRTIDGLHSRRNHL
jgi:hypothetical protein